MTFDLDEARTILSRTPVTLRALLATWVVHDLGHVGQIACVLARQYTDDVGPWQQYLPVLADRRPPA